VLRVPYDCGPTADVRYRTVTLGIVMVNEYLVTICKFKIDVLDNLIQSRLRVVSTAKRNRLVLHILLTTAQSYLTDLRRINSTVEEIEQQLQRSLKNQEVLQLLAYQKSLVYFTTGLKSNELMMHRLQRSHLFEMYADDQELLEDVMTENTQASEMTAISSNISAR
jgi:magnesium transporter